MKHIPILYSTAMVKRKLEKAKTQTRRVVKPQPTKNPHNDLGWDFEYPRHAACNVSEANLNDHLMGLIEHCPYGQPGDVLWTRESWAPIDHSHFSGYLYKADQHQPEGVGVWKPSLHMKKEACRMWDRVLSIRVERVASIGRQDCLAEGIIENVELEDTRHEETYYQYEFGGPRFATAYAAYKALWQKINGVPAPIQRKENGKLRTVGYIVYPFDEQAAQEWQGVELFRGKPLTVVTNALVWVIEFEPCEMPADFLL